MNRPLVVLGIGSSEPMRQWGAQHFAALARTLIDAGWPTLVLAGGNGEETMYRQICTLLGDDAALVIPALGWHMAEVAALLSEAAFYVGNDTGVMNMAAAVGTRAYALFGATPPLHHSAQIVPVLSPSGGPLDGVARFRWTLSSRSSSAIAARWVRRTPSVPSRAQPDDVASNGNGGSYGRHRPDVAYLDRVALGAILLTPLLLLHAHGIAEGAIAVADVCFLARCVITREWAWLRTPWLRAGFAWWGWVTLCSLPIPALDLGEAGLPSLVQGVLIGRFLILIAAMEHAILRDPAPRRWLGWVVTASAIYIAVQSVIQFTFGRNLYGAPHAPDGELTGPFAKPRAGPPLVRILFPALVPSVAALLQRPGIWSVAGGYALLMAGTAVMVLIGQRMPLLLTGLGLVTVALLLPRLRPAMVVSVVLAGLLVPPRRSSHPRRTIASSRSSPGKWRTSPTSQYGELYARALEIGMQNPITGLGASGFGMAAPSRAISGQASMGARRMAAAP